MNFDIGTISWVVGLVLLGLVVQMSFGYLAPEVRERRRRNHRKVISRARRPVVMLSARVPKS